jgi:hypothetical protein
MLKFIIPSVIIIGVIILAMRIFGAWMLRINELIKLLWAIKSMIEVKLTAEELEAVKAKMKNQGY